MSLTRKSIFASALAAKFRCIGAECEDTCCGSWAISVDPATQRKYQRKYDLMNATQETDQGWAMCHDKKTGLCTKYDNGWCGIQKKYGSEYLGDTCHFYPRTYRGFGEHITISLSLSCPEAARLALFSECAFEPTEMIEERLPGALHQFLPEDLVFDQVILIQQTLMRSVLDEAATPEQHMARLINFASNLDGLDKCEWQKATSSFVSDRDLPSPVYVVADPFEVLKSLLTIAIKCDMQHNARLYETIREIERALEVDLHWEKGTLATRSNSKQMWREIQESWERYAPAFSTLLNRWIAAQLFLSFFPFAGWGGTVSEKTAIMNMQFSMVRLALMAACHLEGKAIDASHQVRSVQSLARLFDSVADYSVFYPNPL